MLTFLLIILLICLVIYFYYQKHQLETDNSRPDLAPNNQANEALITFMQTKLNSANLTELKSKLGEKTLDELIEENEDYETEIDLLTRTKNSLEADLLAQSNAFQSRLREKDRELKRVKEDLTSEQKRAEKSQQSLTSEKAQHKGSLERISKLTEQITNLTKQHTEQLRAINLLFDEKAKDYKEINFEGLYALLTKIAQKEKKDD